MRREACHLLGIDSAADLVRLPFRGALFEGFIAAEITKAQLGTGRRRELYFFRDEQGLEVDFLLPGRRGDLTLLECKASRTVRPADANPLLRLSDALRGRRAGRTAVRSIVVHDATPSSPATNAIARGVHALPWSDFISQLE